MVPPARHVNSRPAPRPEILADRYQLVEVLGKGGVGSVYRAADLTNGDRVALKTLEMDGPHAVRLFEREYHTLASIAHPSIVRTLDYGVADAGRRYYTMELIEGRDLYEMAPMPWRELIPHLRDVAQALSLLHARGLVHRDVSPKNIRIDHAGQAKLMDFGALAFFGTAEEVVGTPACIAPEVLVGNALDGRSDLFSLGATGYIALSNIRPYAQRSLSAGTQAYAIAPRSLREVQPEVPRTLDSLLLMMLQPDPDRRPCSAADLIERLNVIAHGEKSNPPPAPATLLASPGLVGRERELAQVQLQLQSATQGLGVALVIEGAARMGKTRLVEQLLVEAQLFGALTVHLEGSEKGPAGTTTYHQLVHGLLAAAPALARECMTREPLISALGEQIEKTGSTDSAYSPEQQRELQAALVRWVQAVSAHHPVVIAIDDADALDAATLAVLFGIALGASEHPILLALTLSKQPHPLSTLHRTFAICAHIKLHRLKAHAIDALVASIFGEVPNRARLARWVEVVSGGVPGHALDLLEALVRRRVIRWLGGSWALPSELSEDRLPSSTEEALALALAELPSDALKLAQVFAMLRGNVPLPLCAIILHSEVTELQSLCERLIADRIAIESKTHYRIAHEGYRTALMDRLDSDEKSHLHRSIGEALLSCAQIPLHTSSTDESSLSRQEMSAALQAGYHLLCGGADEQGGAVLRTTAVLVAKTGHDLADAVPALERVVAAYREQSRSAYELSALMAPLILAGTYLDPRLTYKYGLFLLDDALEATGLRLAERLAHSMPKRPALLLSLVFAALRMSLTRRRLFSARFSEAVIGVYGLMTAVLATLASLCDAETAEYAFNRVRPLGWFPKKHPGSIAHLLQQSLYLCTKGAYDRSTRQAEEVATMLDDSPSMPNTVRQQLRAGAIMTAATMNVYRTDDRCLDGEAALRTIGTPSALEAAAGLRVNYHANRGEMKLHLAAREQLDALAAQGGATWRQDLLAVRCLWWIETQCEDSLGLKRSVRQLELLSRDFPSLGSTHAAAHACYLAERDLASESIVRYGPQLEAAALGMFVLGARHAAAYARVLRLAGLPQRAATLAENVLNSLSQPAREFGCLYHGLQLELGRARANLGDLTGAKRYLEEVCDAQAQHSNPLLHALSHIACAEVSLMQRDEFGIRTHLAAAEPHMRATQYSALFGLAQRLHAAACSDGLCSDTAASVHSTGAEDGSPCSIAKRALAVCRGEAARQQTALDLLLEHSGAAAGYLYLISQGDLTLVAPLQGPAPPDDLHRELRVLAMEWTEAHQPSHSKNNEDDETPCGETETIVQKYILEDPLASPDAKVGSRYQTLFLSSPNNTKRVLVGVVALVTGSRPMAGVPLPLMDTIASVLCNSDGATVMRRYPRASRR